MDYLCKSSFRAALIGDPMGLGKTLQAVISTKVIQDEPVIILVMADLDEGHALGMAQLHALHPCLAPVGKKTDFKPD